MSKSDVVLFGEHHNNPIIHWLQFEATADLHKTNKLTLGAEMFEADNQIELNHFISGKIDQKAFDTVARLWKNYPTDYKPLVDTRKGHNGLFARKQRGSQIGFRKIGCIPDVD